MTTITPMTMTTMVTILKDEMPVLQWLAVQCIEKR